jgi:hypothetical protein
MDAGGYGQSWSKGGAQFRAHISRADWIALAGPTRAPLGAVVSRRLTSEQQTKTLPGAPDGDYDVIVFDTEFANKQAAIETVVLQHETTGWKVDGYYIK